MANSLLQLHEHGQSCWIDDLTRNMLRKGALKRRVEEEYLCGVTSNPSIFGKAIAHGSDYTVIITRLMDACSAKPLDNETLAKAARETHALIVVEDHWIDGGLGDAVAVGSLAPVHRLGIRNEPHSGSEQELLAHYGISRGAFVQKIAQLNAAS